MDVSFISATVVLPNIVPLVRTHTDYIVLIKPQFESLKEEIGKGGIVDSHKIPAILERIKQKLSTHFILIDHCESPIKGAKGNQEFFFWLKNRYNS